MAINFVVEDGTGLSNATSYIAIADANQYVEDYVADSTDWSAASDDVKKQALNVASQFIDLQYVPLQGVRLKEAQALNWPRAYVTDRDGYSVDSDIVPQRVEYATVEVALYFVSNGEVYSQLDSEGRLQAQRITIDVITIQKQWSGSNPQSSLKSKVDGFLAEYMSGGGNGNPGVNAEVRRG